MLDRNIFTLRTGGFTTYYNRVFDNDGEKKATADLMHSGVFLNADAGIHKRWNLLLRAPLLIFNTADPSVETGGLTQKESIAKMGDIELGFRYGFKRNAAWAANVSLLQSLATGYRDEKFNLNTGFSDYYTKVFFTVNYYKSTRWYARTYVGFNNRNMNFGDEFYAGISVYVQIVKNFVVEWNTSGLLPLENASEEPRFYQFGLYHNNQGILSTGLEFSYNSENGLGFFSGINFPVKGQYIYASPLMSLGIKLKFEKHMNSSE